jgi:hypothetical protein
LHCIDEIEEQLGREDKTKRSKAMDTMLVVVFDAESKAYEGKRVLHELDSEDVVTILAEAVIARNADGAARVREGEDLRPIGRQAEPPWEPSLVFSAGRSAPRLALLGGLLPAPRWT